MHESMIAAYDRQLASLKEEREKLFTRNKQGKRVLVEGAEERVAVLDTKINGMLDFDLYDKVIVAFSGGKDSMACVLDLLERGAPKDKMILWHHDIDGREGNDLMDWPITRDYCRAFADLMKLPLRFSWRKGGFEQEMLRNNTATAQVVFEDEDGALTGAKQRPPKRRKTPCGVCGNYDCAGCRQKFPQVTANLAQRWCTSYLKIDVGCKALTNQPAFQDKRTLFVTGERAEESACRSHYAQAENHASDNRDGKRIKRHIEHIRPVHKWDEAKVWDIIKRWNVKPHPCYYAGWGRCSCAACIFGSDNQWASLNAVAPEQIQRIAKYEEKFGLTIHRTLSVPERVEKGKAYDNANLETANCGQLMASEYADDLYPDNWELPSGAFGESAGPT